jgi:hypothetical protein
VLDVGCSEISLAPNRVGLLLPGGLGHWSDEIDHLAQPAEEAQGTVAPTKNKVDNNPALLIPRVSACSGKKRVARVPLGSPIIDLQQNVSRLMAVAI